MCDEHFHTTTHYLGLYVLGNITVHNYSHEKNFETGFSWNLLKYRVSDSYMKLMNDTYIDITFSDELPSHCLLNDMLLFSWCCPCPPSLMFHCYILDAELKQM
jgi:hypothetical protein